MEITYFKKNNDGEGSIIATFGVKIPEWKNMLINNLTVVKGKSGWFIGLPSFKNKDMEKWGKVVSFDKDVEAKFLKKARELVELYIKKEKT